MMSGRKTIQPYLAAVRSTALRLDPTRCCAPPLTMKVCLIAGMIAATAGFAQTTAPTTAPSSFEVHEWVVLVCSPFQSKANQDGMVLSTLPASADSRRGSAPEEQKSDPQPIGVIRLIGSAGTPVDVSLGIPSGKVMATWPKAKTKTNRLLWQNLNLSADLPSDNSMEGQTKPRPLEETDWLNDLRRAPSAWLRSDDALERFLAYDLELDYASPLKIEGGGEFKYQITDRASQPLLDLSLYKPMEAGWRETEIEQLGGPNIIKTTTQATTVPATGSRTVASTWQAVKQSTEITLDVSPATQPADLFAPWRDRLLGEGLCASDTDIIIRILEKHALDPKRLTAVYELDAGEMDRLLPLEVLPEPAKTVRVGLVIVKDADPGVASEIDELVAQLGDDEWSKRDAAYQALSKLGKAAKTQLEKAQNSKDMEVVWRAERLLAAMNGATPTADQ